MEGDGFESERMMQLRLVVGTVSGDIGEGRHEDSCMVWGEVGQL